MNIFVTYLIWWLCGFYFLLIAYSKNNSQWVLWNISSSSSTVFLNSLLILYTLFWVPVAFLYWFISVPLIFLIILNTILNSLGRSWTLCLRRREEGMGTIAWDQFLMQQFQTSAWNLSFLNVCYNIHWVQLAGLSFY